MQWQLCISLSRLDQEIVLAADRVIIRSNGRLRLDSTASVTDPLIRSPSPFPIYFLSPFSPTRTLARPPTLTAAQAANT